MTDQQQQNQPNSPEPIDSYTPEQIAQAQEELNSMSPEELLAFNAYLEALEKISNETQVPEARVVLFTTLYSPRTGMVFHPTVRSHTLEQAFDEMVRGLRYAKEKFDIVGVDEFTHIYGNTLGRKQVQQSTQTQSQTQTQTHTQTQSPSASSQSSGSPSNESGTDVLNKIVIMDEGFGKRTKYFVGKFRFPFADARAADVIAGMCDADTGLTPAMFDVEVGSYEPRHWGGHTLYADWEKVRVNDKYYYNVTRIHK